MKSKKNVMSKLNSSKRSVNIEFDYLWINWGSGIALFKWIYEKEKQLTPKHELAVGNKGTIEWQGASYFISNMIYV